MEQQAKQKEGPVHVVGSDDREAVVTRWCLQATELKAVEWTLRTSLPGGEVQSLRPRDVCVFFCQPHPVPVSSATP